MNLADIYVCVYVNYCETKSEIRLGKSMK